MTDRIPPSGGSPVVWLSNLVRKERNSERQERTQSAAHRVFKNTHRNRPTLAGKKGRKLTSHRPDHKRASNVFKERS